MRLRPHPKALVPLGLALLCAAAFLPRVRKLNGPLARAAQADVIDYQLSPDGSWAVYLADADVDGSFELYAREVGLGARAIRLDPPQLVDRFPVTGSLRISAGGEHLVYLAHPAASARRGLFSVPLDGSAGARDLAGAGAAWPLERAPFHFRDTVEDSVKLLAPRADQKGLDLSCRIAPDVPDALVGDPGRLRQVILNLVGNAIKFTARGGVRMIATVDRKANRIEVQVVDTGPGMNAAQIAALFQPFEQARGARPSSTGTGLGLAISRALVERSHQFHRLGHAFEVGLELGFQVGIQHGAGSLSEEFRARQRQRILSKRRSAQILPTRSSDGFSVAAIRTTSLS